MARFLSLIAALCLFMGLFGYINAVSIAADEDNDENAEIDDEKLEYAKGSLCTYCEYCKFCKLCDKDCPCEASATKPNCHMCKYCKFCNLCKACDTVCSPGGFIDKVTSKLFNSLPSFNKEEVDGDIHGVKDWIEKTRDEL